MSDPLTDPGTHLATLQPAIQAAVQLANSPDVKDFTSPAREKAKQAFAQTVATVMGIPNLYLAQLERKEIQSASETQKERDTAASNERLHRTELETNEKAKAEKLLSEILDRVEKTVAEEDIQPPLLYVAGPALQAMRFAQDEPELRRLYVNLLAASMDRQQARRVQPGFSEVIRQISPDEARIIQFLAETGLYPTISVHGRRTQAGQNGLRTILLLSQQTSLIDDASLDNASQISVYWSNLSRLGMVNLADANHFPVITIDAEDFGFSTDLEKRPEIVAFVKACETQKAEDGLTPLYQGFNFGYGATSLSPFGKAFHEVCSGL